MHFNKNDIYQFGNTQDSSRNFSTLLYGYFHVVNFVGLYISWCVLKPVEVLNAKYIFFSILVNDSSLGTIFMKFYQIIQQKWSK